MVRYESLKTQNTEL